MRRSRPTLGGGPAGAGRSAAGRVALGHAASRPRSSHRSLGLEPTVTTTTRSCCLSHAATACASTPCCATRSACSWCHPPAVALPRAFSRQNEGRACPLVADRSTLALNKKCFLSRLDLACLLALNRYSNASACIKLPKALVPDRWTAAALHRSSGLPGAGRRGLAHES
jgi:hypothetical protein